MRDTRLPLLPPAWRHARTRARLSAAVLLPALVVTALVVAFVVKVLVPALGPTPATYLGSGVIEVADVELGAEIGGRVLSVDPDAVEGRPVHRGQRLLELEPEPYASRRAEALAAVQAAQARQRLLVAGSRQEDIARAKAELDAVQAALAKAKAGPRAETVAAAQAEYLAAKARHANLKQRYDRVLNLEREGIEPLQNRDDLEAAADVAARELLAKQRRWEELRAGTRPEDLDAAAARVRAAQATLARYERGFRAEELAEAAAALDSARARLALAQRDVAETVLRAPVDGILEVFDLEPGDLVVAGRPVATIVRPDRLYARAFVAESAIAGLAGKRQPLEVRLTAYPELGPLAAELVHVARQGEFTPRNIQTAKERAKVVYRVKVRLLDPPENLAAGLGADLYLSPE